MRRGSVYSIEILLIFLAWMLILVLVWNQSNHQMKNGIEEWKWNRMGQIARAQSDALMLQHHIQPWKGCAHYDEEKRRSQPNAVEENCLYQLAGKSPPHGVHGVSVWKKGKEIIFYQREKEGKDCIIVGRPIILYPQNQLAILRVSACEE